MPELLTSLDIVNQSFKKSLRGYDTAEVDEFLDNVAEALQAYNKKNKELEQELAAKQESLAEYDRMKDVLHEALLMAQKSADDRVKSAREQANKILEDARAEAEAMRRDTAEEVKRLRAGVEQIRNIRDMYAQEFRGMLAKFDNQLTQSINASQLKGAVEAVLEDAPKDEAESPAESQNQPEGQEQKNSRKDLEAAYGLLGVNPEDLIGKQD
ncbi:MAG: DivIVA domain-containing protein [Synergistes jonesii]|uniref:DivIVA domain-containing protein n=1 Tax=Synergistes jonesii TaxID=2754 RepID=UPI002A74884D|nr:DivIVA domain-containing protein [Synergistes jonesii]MDY2985288.1 DivIVA domain-containing protein [Synergistes jonesii]